MMLKMKLFSLLLIIAAILGVSFAVPRKLTIAVVTDTHIGESCNGDLSMDGCKPVRALTDAVAHLNELGVDAVFATGDLTASALKEEFVRFREIMEDLKMPWWPLLGNHDSWPYTRHSDGSFNQTDAPIGDVYFAEVFGDILSGSRDPRYGRTVTRGWPAKACPNQDFQYNSWFHNFVVTFPTFSTNLKFLNLDWVARENALPEPGVGPQAELHDFSCGTLDWLSKTLKSQDPVSKFFIMQHHPFHNRDSFSPFGHNLFMNFTFDDKQNARVQHVLSESFTVDSFLGVHAGHMHRWFDGKAFTKFTAIDDSWLGLKEWETPASKGWWINEDFLSSTQLFTFVTKGDGLDSDVVLENVHGLWKVPPTGKWQYKPSP